MDTFIIYGTALIVYAGIPFWFVFAPVFSKNVSFIPARKISNGILLSTFIMWPLMVVHRIGIELPYNLARTDDPGYDGVGGNVAILMMGWLLAILCQVPHIVLRLLVDLIIKSKRRD